MLVDATFERVKVLGTRKYMVRVYAYMFLDVLLTGLLTWQFRSIVIAVLGGIIFLFLPVIFKKWLIKQFMAEATFSLSSVDITIVFHAMGRKQGDIFHIPLNDLASYRVDDCETTVRIKFYLANGAKRSFQVEKADQEQNSIVDTIVANIKAYNSIRSDQQSIDFRRHFITTRMGLVLLVGFGLIWTFVFIYLIVRKPEIWPTSAIGGAALCLQMFHLRKRELKMNEEHS